MVLLTQRVVRNQNSRNYCAKSNGQSEDVPAKIEVSYGESEQLLTTSGHVLCWSETRRRSRILENFCWSSSSWKSIQASELLRQKTPTYRFRSCFRSCLWSQKIFDDAENEYVETTKKRRTHKWEKRRSGSSYRNAGTPGLKGNSMLLGSAEYLEDLLLKSLTRCNRCVNYSNSQFICSTRDIWFKTGSIIAKESNDKLPPVP